MLDGDDGYCYCLITNVPDSTVESYILGEPWFKTVVVTLDYDADYIQIYNKNDSAGPFVAKFEEEIRIDVE